MGREGERKRGCPGLKISMEVDDYNKAVGAGISLQSFSGDGIYLERDLMWWC